MGEGPRDWSPAGYWNEPPEQSHSPNTTIDKSGPQPARLWGLTAVFLGLVACWLPLSVADAGAGFRGFTMTTAGVTAVFLAQRAGRAGHRVLATLGVLLGLFGTILCGWSVAAFYIHAGVPAVPSISSLTAQGQPMLPTVPAGAAARAPRVVAPIPGANIAAEPTGQLRENLRHVVFALGVGLSASQQYGTLPTELLFHADGTVYYGSTTLSKVPAYMVVNYELSADKQDFVLRVSDAESGMAVSTDSVTRTIVDQ
jgi:hypothetical protein